MVAGLQRNPFQVNKTMKKGQRFYYYELYYPTTRKRIPFCLRWNCTCI